MKPMKKSDRFAKVVNNDGKAEEKVNPRLNILPGSSISSGLIERVWLLPGGTNPDEDWFLHVC